MPPVDAIRYAEATDHGSRLLAIMLGRMRMTTTECFQALQRLPGNVSTHSPGISLMRHRSRGEPDAMEDFVGELVRDFAPAKLQREEEDVFASDPVQCKTIVVGSDSRSGKPVLFRIYGLEDGEDLKGEDEAEEKVLRKIKSTTKGLNNEPQRELRDRSTKLLRIADVVRATVDSHHHSTQSRAGSRAHVDEGVLNDNPSLLMYSELEQLRHEATQTRKEPLSDQKNSRKSRPLIETFVSIAISSPRTPLTEAKKDSKRSFLQRTSIFLHKLQAHTEADPVSSNEVESNMLSKQQDGSISNYFRFSTTSSSLSTTSLQDNGPLQNSESLTHLNPDLKANVERCAKAIAGIKRQRERTRRWLCFSQAHILADRDSSSSMSAKSQDYIRNPSEASGDSSYIKDSSLQPSPYLGDHKQDISRSHTLIPNAEQASPAFQPSSRHKHTFLWRIPDLYQELKPQSSLNCFDNIVTITRLSEDKYWACACLSFLQNYWPQAVPTILPLLSRICATLVAKDAEYVFTEDGTAHGNLRINVRATPTFLTIELVDPEARREEGEEYTGSFAELVDSLRWLICALIPNDGKKGLFRTYMALIPGSNTWAPAFHPFSPHRATLYSWTAMFEYACIIDFDLSINGQEPVGLPNTLSNHHLENEPNGLKIEYELLWELAGIERAWLYDGGLLLSNFDTVLFPLRGREWDDGVRWRLKSTPGKIMRVGELGLGDERAKMKSLDGVLGKEVYLE